MFPGLFRSLLPSANDSVREWWCSLRSRCRSDQKEIHAMAILGMRKIWLERNARTFDRASSTLQQVLNQASTDLALWKTARVLEQGAGRNE